MLMRGHIFISVFTSRLLLPLSLPARPFCESTMLILIFCALWTLANSAHLNLKRNVDRCTASNGNIGYCSLPVLGCRDDEMGLGPECPSMIPLRSDSKFIILVSKLTNMISRYRVLYRLSLRMLHQDRLRLFHPNWPKNRWLLQNNRLSQWLVENIYAFNVRTL